MSMVKGAIIRIDVDKVNALIVSSGLWSRGAFGRLCGIDHVTFTRILRRGTCQVEMLDRIARKINIPTSELVEEVGIFDNEPQKFRAKANLSTDDLAKKAGVSASVIHRVEKGGDCRSFDAFCLAKALGLTVEEYFGYGA